MHNLYMHEQFLLILELLMNNLFQSMLTMPNCVKKRFVCKYTRSQQHKHTTYSTKRCISIHAINGGKIAFKKYDSVSVRFDVCVNVLNNTHPPGKHQIQQSTESPILIRLVICIYKIKENIYPTVTWISFFLSLSTNIFIKPR